MQTYIFSKIFNDPTHPTESYHFLTPDAENLLNFDNPQQNILEIHLSLLQEQLTDSCKTQSALRPLSPGYQST